MFQIFRKSMDEGRITWINKSEMKMISRSKWDLNQSWNMPSQHLTYLLLSDLIEWRSTQCAKLNGSLFNCSLYICFASSNCWYIFYFHSKLVFKYFTHLGIGRLTLHVYFILSYRKHSSPYQKISLWSLLPYSWL